MIGAENLDLVANGWSLHRKKMSEEAFSALRVGLFGICSGDAFSWDQQSLLPPFLDVNPTCCQISSPPHIPLSELDQVALDFTSWPQQVAVTGHSGSPASAAHRAAPASAAHLASLASAAHHAAGIGSCPRRPGIGSSPRRPGIGSSPRRRHRQLPPSP